MPRPYIPNGSSGSSFPNGTVDLFADLPVSTGSGNIYFVENPKTWAKNPRGFYEDSATGWINTNIKVELANDSGTLINWSNWLAYISVSNGISIGDRIIFDSVRYESVTGIETTIDPSIDTTNFKIAIPKLDSLIDPLEIGSNGNTTTFEEDGTWQNKGDSTVWDDVVNSLIGRRLYSNQGTIDYDYNENAILFSDGGDITDRNDRVVFNLQYPHSAKEDGTMNLHIHWTQENTTDIEFTVQYRIQSNGALKTTAWTTAISSSNTNNVFTYTAGTLNQITKLVDVDMAGAGISATVQFRMTRSDNNGGTIMGTFVDAHIERDMNGSREEFVK